MERGARAPVHKPDVVIHVNIGLCVSLNNTTKVNSKLPETDNTSVIHINVLDFKTTADSKYISHFTLQQLMITSYGGNGHSVKNVESNVFFVFFVSGQLYKRFTRCPIKPESKTIS